MPTRAIHQLRSARRKPIWRSCISTAIRKPKRKHLWTTQPCRPERYIRRDQQSESLHVTAVYQQCGILTAISKAKAYLAQLCISSVQRSNPLRQLRSATRHHTWRGCVSTPRRNKNKTKALSGRHSRVDQSGLPTAIRRTKAYIVQLYINGTLYQLRAARRKHIWRSCVSTAISKANSSGNCDKQSGSISGAAVYHKSDQKDQSESTSGRHSRVDKSGV